MREKGLSIAGSADSNIEVTLKYFSDLLFFLKIMLYFQGVADTDAALIAQARARFEAANTIETKTDAVDIPLHAIPKVWNSTHRLHIKNIVRPRLRQQIMYLQT